MSKSIKINNIVNFVTSHPQTVASRRICREIIGEALERFNEEFAVELETGLNRIPDEKIDSFYSLVK
ncbi:MAG: hypothetical protein GXY86_11515 [Firmicutes bacterium]|nr:hypothetical protein [Bacillota bacterium]